MNYEDINQAVIDDIKICIKYLEKVRFIDRDEFERFSYDATLRLKEVLNQRIENNVSYAIIDSNGNILYNGKMPGKEIKECIIYTEFEIKPTPILADNLVPSQFIRKKHKCILISKSPIIYKKLE